MHIYVYAKSAECKYTQSRALTNPSLFHPDHQIVFYRQYHRIEKQPHIDESLVDRVSEEKEDGFEPEETEPILVTTEKDDVIELENRRDQENVCGVVETYRRFESHKITDEKVLEKNEERHRLDNSLRIRNIS